MARPKKEKEIVAMKITIPILLWEKWWDQLIEHDSTMDKDLAYLLGMGGKPVYKKGCK